jgi:allantoinase
MYDTLIRGGMLVREQGVERADLAISDQQVVAIATELSGAAKQEIAADGLHLFPGGIDPHMHCNDPGRSDWEGFPTATAALALGGFTSMIDMPLNAHPPTCDAASFAAKMAAAHGRTTVDYALWGGLVPGNRADLAELAALGVVGFKAFMSNSGTSDFMAADELTLYEGMQEAARLGRVVAVHAESNQITAALSERAIAAGRTGIRDYLESRPIIAELEAIGSAIVLAEATKCKLHIVHVSSGRGITMVAEARARGVDVSCETCPHYLIFTGEDVERLGAVAKCAPPLRDRHEVEALWELISQGQIEMVTSDHSPAPPDMKTDPNFFKVWGGISGCQSTLGIMLHEGYRRRGLALYHFAALLAGGAARRFGLWPRKGQIAIGSAADLVLIDLRQQITLQRKDLHYQHQLSPYIGMPHTGKIIRTILRGTTIVQQGQMIASGRGQFLPHPA